MHSRERYYAFLNDNRIVHPFGWGVEFIDKIGGRVERPARVFPRIHEKKF